jgi:hypothetical protein
VEIVAALFVESIDLRQGPGGSARIDLGGVYFSTPAPHDFPVEITPHLAVLIRCPPDHGGMAALEVRFTRDGEQVARNVQPVQVEPGKFSRQLVQAQLTFDEPGTVEAHCRIDQGHVLTVPLTVNPPV